MTPVFVTQIVARVIAVVQIGLGILLWTGSADSLAPIHMAIGLPLVLDLWVATGLALRAGAPIALAVLTVAWSIGMPILGMVQTSLFPGSAHVVIQVVHLLVGLFAVGLVEMLARAPERAKARA